MAKGTKIEIIIEVAEALQRRFSPGTIVAVGDAERVTDKIAPNLPEEVRYTISRGALDQAFVRGKQFVYEGDNWQPAKRYVRQHKISVYGRKN